MTLAAFRPRCCKPQRIFGDSDAPATLAQATQGSSMAQPVILYTTAFGVLMKLDPSEYIDSEICTKGCFEPDTTKAIASLVKQGDTVVDVGANIGCHTLLMAQLLGNAGMVYAFEPMAYAYRKLMVNRHLNDFQNIVIEKLAISDVTGVEEVVYNSSWPRNGVARAEASLLEPIEHMRLDDYYERHGITACDFIKIDTDGNEFKVLRGARGVLERFRPVLCMELGAYTLQRVGDDLSAMVAHIQSLGYKVCRETDLEPFADVQQILDLVGTTTTINAIALPA